MIDADKSFGESILDTAWARYSTAEKMPSEENMDRMRSYVFEAISRYAYSNDRTARLSMAELLLKVTELRCTHDSKIHLFFNDVATFFNLTSLNEMPETIVNKKALWPMLAAYCLFSACHEDNEAPDNTTDRVATYLTLMLGRKVLVREAFSKEIMTDLLYGPAVWDLYRSDVLRDEDMPLHLFKQNVPLLCLNNAKQPNDVAVDLPKELY